MTITQPDGAVLHVEKPTRGSADFRLVNLPADRSLAYASITNSMAGLLTDLAFDDVQPVATFTTDDDKPTRTRFETFDGLIIEAAIYATPDGPRLRFAAIADAGLAAQFGAAEAEPPCVAPTTSSYRSRRRTWRAA